MSILAPEQPTRLPHDAPPALVLTRAADLLAANGLHPSFYRHGTLYREYWPDEQAQNWRPGLPLSPLGAIGVALGLRNRLDVTAHVIPCADLLDEDNHPAVDALCDHIGLDTVMPGL